MIEGSSESLKCLEEFFNNTPVWRQHCWQGAKTLDRKCHYGSYKPISREKLSGRHYRVTMEDWGALRKPSIEWLDVYFDPKTRTYLEKQQCE